jgi:hypothetical protein
MAQARTNTGRSSDSREWISVLDELDVQFLILDTRRDSELLRLVRLEAGWTVDFEDGDRVLFARARPLERGLAST